MRRKRWNGTNRTAWANINDLWQCPDCGYPTVGTSLNRIRLKCPRCGKPAEQPWIPGMWYPENTLIVYDEQKL